MSDHKIDVNILRLLENQRKMYEHETCVLDELIQNAQRAKAKHIQIFLNHDSISVVDDGCGIDNPQDILTIGDSGWDQETMKDEDPFGMGFFASLLISDSVRIASKNHIILISSDDLNATVYDDVEPVKGTRVTLSSLKPAYDIDEFVSYIVDSFKYLPIPITLYAVGYDSDILVGCEKVKPDDGSDIYKVYNEEGMRGYVRPIVGDDWEKKDERGIKPHHIKILLHGRVVCNYFADSLVGILNVTNETLTFKAPERKSIIEDKKYDKFSARMSRAKKELVAKILRKGRFYEEEYWDFLNRNNGFLTTEFIHDNARSVKVPLYGKKATIDALRINPDEAEMMTFVQPNEVMHYEKELGWAKHLHVPILEISKRNPVFQQMIEYSLTIDNISDVFDKFIVTLRSFESSQREDVRKLSGRIERFLQDEYGEDVWLEFGTITTATEIHLSNGRVKDSNRGKKVRGLRSGNHIYVELDGRGNPSIATIFAKHVRTIAHEAAHAIYDTKDETVDHYKTESRILARMLDAIINGELAIS